ncbi:MAG: hypothetical protein H7281_19315, partial [Bacteriovorax sp.]|nr:hypothetical protein [Bacteriovorax sp.]
MNATLKIAFLISTLFIQCPLYASELDSLRTQNTFDSCVPDDVKIGFENTFEKRIELWVSYYLSHEVDLEMGDINPYYNIKDGLERISLSDIKFCEVDNVSLERSLKNVPDAKTIDLLNTIFFDQMNNGDKQQTAQKIFTCLAMEESLGDPDTASSKKVYREVTGKNDKPSGVKFYIDPLQKKESELNIGLYQFTPNASGNINPCLKAWNKMFSNKQNCQVKNKSDVLEALGSPGQNLNAFCGIHKIIETASIQMKSPN